ncbi:hypothetical protein [Arachidicoccus sp.]|uniref:hypothetical protein n=1 Tax=Arachidicoccus sp. TaxID=1872624 RepID=UPI003D212947
MQKSRLSRLLPVFAIAAGIALVGVTSAFKEAPKANVSDLTTYYFQFNGSNGQEDQPAEWSQIDATTYTLSPCNSTHRGCVLATTSVTGSGSNLHPSQVDVDGSGSNKSPKTGDGVIEVKNRDDSY